jgi:hypothetical protein
MQALEFQIRSTVGEFEDARQCLGVMGGELGVKRFRCGEEAPGAGEIGHIGVGLARKDGIAGEPLLLRPLDLGVPIGSLDEANAEALPMSLGQMRQPVDQG